MKLNLKIRPNKFKSQSKKLTTLTRVFVFSTSFQPICRRMIRPMTTPVPVRQTRLFPRWSRTLEWRTGQSVYGTFKTIKKWKYLRVVFDVCVYNASTVGFKLLIVCLGWILIWSMFKILLYVTVFAENPTHRWITMVCYFWIFFWIFRTVFPTVFLTATPSVFPAFFPSPVWFSVFSWSFF